MTTNKTRKPRSKNTCKKYLVEIVNDKEEVLTSVYCCSYPDIVEKFPVWNHEDNVRAYFRRFSKVGFNTKKTKRKYGMFRITKIDYKKQFENPDDLIFPIKILGDGLIIPNESLINI